MSPLILKRAPIGPHQEEHEVLEDGVFVGRIFLVPIGLKGRPWMWTLAYGYHEDRTPTHGYEADARGCDGSVRQELAQKLAIHARLRGRLRRRRGTSVFGNVPYAQCL